MTKFNSQTAKLQSAEERPVYVIGHQNPDTDSICSAIAYANLKEKITGKRYIPKRAGQMNLETKYVLKRFGVKAPYYLSDARRQVKDMEVNALKPIRGCLSLKRAWERMRAETVSTLPVCTIEGVLEGIITEGDIAESYMGMYTADILAQAMDNKITKTRKTGMSLCLIFEKRESEELHRISMPCTISSNSG